MTRWKLGLAALLALSALVACSGARGPDLDGMSFSAEPLAGKMVWHDLVTEDLEAARRFYGGLFGWRFEEASRRDGRPYVLARDGEVYVAGLLGIEPPDNGDRLSRWLPYLSVADVDRAVASSRASGAEVLVDARDVPLGRVAAIVDPQGAVLGLARSRIGDPDDRTTRAAVGRIVWNELLASDPAAAAAFYRRLAGLDARILERRGGRYTLLSANGVDRAGVLARPSAELEPLWLTYFGVSDPTAAARRAEALGGEVLLAPSRELREGSMAVVTDPAGAVLVLQRLPI